MESESWKSIGKIFASIALSALVAFFWISNFEKTNIKDYTKSAGQKQSASLQAHLNKPFTLVSFWATWCDNCEESLKGFDGLSSEVGPDFSFLSISLDKDLVEAQGFWNQLELTNSKLIFDEDENIRKNLNVEILPTYFLISESGDLLLRLEGNIKWDDPKVIKLLQSTGSYEPEPKIEALDEEIETTE